MPQQLQELLTPLVSLLAPLNERIEQLDKEFCKRAKATSRPNDCSRFQAQARSSR